MEKWLFYLHAWFCRWSVSSLVAISLGMRPQWTLVLRKNSLK